METDLSGCVEVLRDTSIALLDTDFTAVTDEAFLTDWVEFERCMRRLNTAVSNRMVVEVSARGFAGRNGFKSMHRYLKGMLRLSGSEAWRRVRDAVDFGLWPTTLTGDTVASRHPHVTAAQRDGDVGVEHGHRIREVMTRIPASIEPEHREAAEAVLADTARTASPDDVGDVGLHVLAHLDPDGKLTNDADRARRRSLRLSRQDPDLMSRVTGNLDPATRAMLDVVLAKWAAPGFNNPHDDQSLSGPADAPDIDPAMVEAAAGRDHRTQEQRNHDALTALLRHMLEGPDLGEHNGLPMHLILTMTLQELEDEAGVATTATGGVVPVKDALRMAEKTRRYLCVFDHEGRPLHFGRDKRTATLDQRLALFAAEKGCTRPGCGVPAAGCQAHHRDRDWIHGGRTDINELTLVCPGDHGILADNDGVHTPEGWFTRPGPDGSPNAGRTEWVPPTTVDPKRAPRVNDRHHPAVLLAAAIKRVIARREADRQAWLHWLDTHTNPNTDDP